MNAYRTKGSARPRTTGNGPGGRVIERRDESIPVHHLRRWPLGGPAFDGAFGVSVGVVPGVVLGRLRKREYIDGLATPPADCLAPSSGWDRMWFTNRDRLVADRGNEGSPRLTTVGFVLRGSPRSCSLRQPVLT